MPQVNKTAENEKFATLILELLNTQKDIIERLEAIDKKIGSKADVTEDDWGRI